MDLAPILYAAAALASGGAAVLAWVAKLKWAQEYKDATEQVIRSKEAEIAVLRTHVEVLEATGSAKILERAKASIAALESALAETEARASAAEWRVVERERELAAPASVPAMNDARRAELEADLRVARSEASHLAGEADFLRLRLLERRRALLEQVGVIEGELERSADRLARLEEAPGLLNRFADELHQVRAKLRGAQAELEERLTTWQRDRQDADTKLQQYRDRAAGLLEQARQIREAGPAGKCPVCERPLGQDFERVRGELEDQWGNVVQDGKWWKSRREQLEDRPPEVVTMEVGVGALERTLELTTRKHTRAESAMRELRDLTAEREGWAERAHALRREIDALEEVEREGRDSARISDKTP